MANDFFNEYLENEWKSIDKELSSDKWFRNDDVSKDVLPQQYRNMSTTPDTGVDVPDSNDSSTKMIPEREEEVQELSDRHTKESKEDRLHRIRKEYEERPFILVGVNLYQSRTKRARRKDLLNRFAQVTQPGELLQPANVDSPQVYIEPSVKAEIEDAVQQLRAMDANYFKGVSKIVALHGGAYGQVSSDDPTIIQINLDRIKNEVKQKIGKTFDDTNPEHREMFEEIVKKVLISTIAHEKGHVADWDAEEHKFPSGENVAERESAEVVNKMFPQGSSRVLSKTARDLGLPKALEYWNDFINSYWPTYKEKFKAFLKSRKYPESKINWDEKMVDAWEEYTNDIVEILEENGLDDDAIDKLILKLDEYMHQRIQ